MNIFLIKKSSTSQNKPPPKVSSLSTTVSNTINQDEIKSILLSSKKPSHPTNLQAATPFNNKTSSLHTAPTSTSKSNVNLSLNKKDLTLNKRARNLNLAKEKLYEMKKSIDAKVNIDTKETTMTPATTATTPANKPFLQNKKLISPNATSSSTVRTTPRKVKKRSGERSLTTGLLLENERDLLKEKSKSKENLEFIQQFKSSNGNHHQSSLSIKSSKNMPSSNYASNYRKTSSSLHNLSQHQQSSPSNTVASNNNNNASLFDCDHQQRNRRDSYASTISNITCTSYTVSLNNTHLGTGNNEYKENKAYELRKKSNLMNKIITKTQAANDPIYTRAHPVFFSTDSSFSEPLTPTSSLTMATCLNTTESARKRLFAKKNERPQQQQFDANVNICLQIFDKNFLKFYFTDENSKFKF